ncbi:UDP-N-acetyl-D-glucosamine dehydrogenase [Arthrobacter agilis]|jgi:nucleotide sugar dehydrogenase|nr:UDP-N-acetyl-D-glucosamine dehydrogenase [Arthrobacter agilis]
MTGNLVAGPQLSNRHSAPKLLDSSTTLFDTALEQQEPAFEFDVAIVGMGYVGLPTALAFTAAGARVLGVDASPVRLDVIRSGRADLVTSDRERLTQALADPYFELTTDSARLSQAAAVIICVPTPVDAYLVPDLAILSSACETVVEQAVSGQLLLLTSTTYVGTTRDLLATPLARRGLIPGSNIHLAFSPERINPGADNFAHEDVPRVVGGITKSCTTAAVALIGTYTRSIHVVSSADAAEMTKLVENTFRAVNIGLANEFADMSHSLDLDVMEVIGAAATKPYGFMAFTPGPGVGGHCIPCDPHYLLWQMRKLRLSTPVIEQAMNAIAARPGKVVDRIRKILSDRDMGLHSARILVVGVAYKPDVEDLRESPALEILSSLMDEGAVVAYHDHLIPTVRLGDGTMLEHDAEPDAFQADLILLHTAHSAADVTWISPEVPVLDSTFRLPLGSNIYHL